MEDMAEAGVGDFYRTQNDSSNSADDPLILGQYDLRDIEESLGEGDVAWGGGWQVNKRSPMVAKGPDMGSNFD